MQLPATLSVQEFGQQFRLKPELWRAAVIECCDRHGLPNDSIRTYTDGTNLVASVGDLYVVKIFPPFLKHQWESEHRVLAHLKDKTDVIIPELIASGRRNDDWHYVIVTKLTGITFEGVWCQFSLPEKAKILKRVGQIMKSVHQVPVGELKTLPPYWPEFIQTQIDNVIERHRRLNMPAWFLNDLPYYLSCHQSLIPKDFKPVILTGEYTPFNMLTPVVKDSVVTGMIDFGDAMIGYSVYDLVGPSVFMAEGQELLVHALLDGYGLTHSDITDGLQHKMMLMLILHRYSHLQNQIRISEWETKAHTITELANVIWPLNLAES